MNVRLKMANCYFSTMLTIIKTAGFCDEAETGGLIL